MQVPEKLNPSTDDQLSSPHAKAIAPFLQPGEEYHSNYGLIGSVEHELPPIDVYIARLQQSGKFTSIRYSKEAVFDAHGRPYVGSAAIIVRRKPEPAATELPA